MLGLQSWLDPRWGVPQMRMGPGGGRTGNVNCLHSYTSGKNVHFLLPGFPATPPRNHKHPQLGGSSPADGAVKGLLWLGYIGPHGGLVGA